MTSTINYAQIGPCLMECTIHKQKPSTYTQAQVLKKKNKVGF